MRYDGVVCGDGSANTAGSSASSQSRDTTALPGLRVYPNTLLKFGDHDADGRYTPVSTKLAELVSRPRRTIVLRITEDRVLIETCADYDRFTEALADGLATFLVDEFHAERVHDA